MCTPLCGPDHWWAVFIDKPDRFSQVSTWQSVFLPLTRTNASRKKPRKTRATHGWTELVSTRAPAFLPCGHRVPSDRARHCPRDRAPRRPPLTRKSERHRRRNRTPTNARVRREFTRASDETLHQPTQRSPHLLGDSGRPPRWREVDGRAHGELAWRSDLREGSRNSLGLWCVAVVVGCTGVGADRTRPLPSGRRPRRSTTAGATPCGWRRCSHAP